MKSFQVIFLKPVRIMEYCYWDKL